MGQLAREGPELLTDAHSAASTCTPSRYGLLTGINPVRTGVLNHPAIRRANVPSFRGEDEKNHRPPTQGIKDTPPT